MDADLVVGAVLPGIGMLLLLAAPLVDAGTFEDERGTHEWFRRLK